jgi:hypothetical protein
LRMKSSTRLWMGAVLTAVDIVILRGKARKLGALAGYILNSAFRK